MKPKRIFNCAIFIILSVNIYSQSWVQSQVITEGYSNIGQSIDYDGKNLITTNGWEDVSIFQWKDTLWKERYILTLPGRDTLLSVGINGDYAAIGAPIKNLVQIFHFTGVDWVEDLLLIPSDLSDYDKYGYKVEIDDRFLFISSINDDDSAMNCGSVYAYKKTGLTWAKIQKILPSNASEVKEFGSQLSLSGDYLMVGSEAASYIFKWDGIKWNQQVKIDIPTSSVGISDNFAIVAGSGEVSIYSLNGTSWTFLQKIVHIGASYAVIDEHQIVIGEYSFDEENPKATVYELLNTNWVLKQTIHPYNNSENPEHKNLHFGYQIFLSDNILFISDPFYGENFIPDPAPQPGALYCYFLKNEQTINFPAIPDKTYGDAPFSHNAAASSGFPVQIISSNESVAKAFGDQIQIFGAGVCDFSASQKGDSATLPKSENRTLFVNKALLNITAENKSRQYGSDNPGFTLICNGLVNSDNISVIHTLPTILCDATIQSKVGLYPINLMGGFDENYSFNLINGQLDIIKAPLQVKVDNVSRLYGQSNPTFTLNITGYRNEDNIDDIDVLPLTVCEANTLSDAGKYNIIVSGGSDDDYDFSYINGELEILKATLEVTAEDQIRYYGEPNPEFTYSVSGLLNGNSINDIDTLPSISCDADLVSNVGYYDITLGSGWDNNYFFVYNKGQLLVNKALLTVQAINATRNVGEENPNFLLSFNGFANDENESVIDVLPEVNCMANLQSEAGNYPISLSGGSDNNYQFIFLNGVLTVNAITSVPQNNVQKPLFWPNPVKDRLFLNLEKCRVFVYSMDGSLLKSNNYNEPSIDLSEIPKGVYLISIDGVFHKLNKE